MSHHLETGSCPNAASLNRNTIHKAIQQRDPHGLVTMKQLEWHAEVEATDRCWNGYGYECYLCHKVYNSLRDLNSHVNSGPHRQKIYHCPNRGCSKEFVSLAALFNHLESESCGFISFEKVQKSVTGILGGHRYIAFWANSTGVGLHLSLFHRPAYICFLLASSAVSPAKNDCVVFDSAFITSSAYSCRFLW